MKKLSWVPYDRRKRSLEIVNDSLLYVLVAKMLKNLSAFCFAKIQPVTATNSVFGMTRRSYVQVSHSSFLLLEAFEIRL